MKQLYLSDSKETVMRVKDTNGKNTAIFTTEIEGDHNCWSDVFTQIWVVLKSCKCNKSVGS